MPDTTASGQRGRTRFSACSATYTESAGVPSTEKTPSPCGNSRSGRCRLSEWLAALCSVSGAQTTTSTNSSSAARNDWRPSERYPSSFDKRTSGRVTELPPSALRGSARFEDLVELARLLEAGHDVATADELT